MKNKYLLCLLALPAILLYPACDQNKEEDIEQLKTEALSHYAAIVQANYEDCLGTLATYSISVDEFLANPSDAGLQSCKNAWLAARLPYGQSEAFRFYGGPIDDENGPEGLINAWPMDESFVDYVVGNPNSGIINNPAQYPQINKQLLVGLNELFSEESIFSGYHAAEFLLWGQDLSDTGPGARPFTDYVVGPSGSASNQDRRGQYLKVVSDLLTENLTSVRDEWTSDGPFRKLFLETNESKKSIGLIFSGLAEFCKTELSGERMFVAIDVQDQEHEHSCFSDNTLNDLRMNFKGIENVYFGRYTRVNGTELSGMNFDAILRKIDLDMANTVAQAIQDTENKINDIPAPFDQTILNNTAPVASAIESLRSLSDLLLAAGLTLGAEY